jgi:hypothetical protein
MKPGGGKRKGGSFERKISKELSLWWTDGKSKDIFWRTHSSGAMGTVGGRKWEYGDIMAIDEAGKALTQRYNIELRHSKGLDIADLVYGTDKSGMAKFLREGRKTAELSGRQPLWIFKEHLRPTMVMMDVKGLEDIVTPLFVTMIGGAFPGSNILLMTFEAWKKSVNKKAIKEGAKGNGC